MAARRGSNFVPIPDDIMQRATQQATILGEGARVEGDLHLDHDAIVAGEILGDLHVAGSLELTATARVHGNVSADAVKLAGHVAGNVTAQHATELLAGARLEGLLDTARLIAAEDAAFDGQLRLRGASPASPSQPQPQTPGFAQPAHTEASAAQPLAFSAVPGLVNAGLRTRRRAAPSPA